VREVKRDDERGGWGEIRGVRVQGSGGRQKSGVDAGVLIFLNPDS